mmetsp:Transcript_30799/g.55814  ORF Transcript_30799/g.55814 Transcript_30799/m.55814 type:complete len:252 (-) Transcript_30799:686-1441(-)
MRKDHCWNEVVRYLGILPFGSAEQTIGQTTPSSNGHWRQLNVSADIAQGENSIDVCLGVFIDIDVASLYLLNTSGWQVQWLNIGATTRSHQDCVHISNDFSILEVHSLDTAIIGNFFYTIGISVNFNSLSLHFFIQSICENLIKVAQCLFLSHHQGSVAAKCMQDTCKFHRNISCPNDYRFVRKFFEFKEPIRGNAILSNAFPRRKEGIPTRRQQNVFGFVCDCIASIRRIYLNHSWAGCKTSSPKNLDDS